MSTDLSASAEVIISGTPDAVRIEASNATIEEVLLGLGVNCSERTTLYSNMRMRRSQSW
jgi:hypothetical protein